MKSFFLLSLLSALSANLLSQSAGNDPVKKGHVIFAQLLESLRRQPIADGTVSLLNAKDSSLIAFTRTDSFGRFYFNQLPAGYYLLSAAHINFQTQWKSLSISPIDSVVKLADIFLRDKTVLEELTLHAQRPPVEVNGDTLEFNAESFKTKPNAVVEDMLKKMPGIAIDKDGTVRVNGKQIRRVLVNGKDFFYGDPKIATRNLPADAVDKVQVFDKQSDQAAFTGIDDGNAEKTINLKLKKNTNSAVFGKASAEAGNRERYDVQFNVNKFKNDQQLSAIGMANNTNRQGFSILDILNFTGQSKKMLGGGAGMVINTIPTEDIGLPVNGLNNSQGIITTNAAGINYNDRLKNKTDINVGYFFNDLMPADTRLVNRQNIVPGNNFICKQYSHNNGNTAGNRFNFSADHRIDSFNTIKLTTVTSYQKAGVDNKSNYGSFEPDGIILNSGSDTVTNSSQGYNIDNTLLYRHKYKKRSRTFYVNASMQYNDSRLSGTQNSVNNFFAGGIINERDTLNQVTKLLGITQSYGVKLSYTEPLSKRSLMELKVFTNSNIANVDRNTFDYNNADGKHDIRNALQSNGFESHYQYSGSGLALRTQKKKYGYAAGMNLQFARLTNHLGNAFFIRQGFTNLLPSANFSYNFSKMKTFRLDYTSSTAQPTASQLQPVKDVSDPLNIKEGNPFLKQSYAHNLGLQFFKANPSKQKNLFVFINYQTIQNAITNSDVIDASGIRTTRPVNTDGIHYIRGTADNGFRIKKLSTRFTVGCDMGFNRSVNFLNGQKNKTVSLSLAPRVSVNYTYNELIDVTFNATVGYNHASYSLQPALNNNYWRQSYDVEATINFPAGITFNNNCSYKLFTGRANGFNKSSAIWNSSISIQVLKNKKGSIGISAYDLLKQDFGVERNTGNNYVEDIQYQTLQRFFTIGFTYSLQKPVAGGPKAVIRAFK